MYCHGNAMMACHVMAWYCHELSYTAIIAVPCHQRERPGTGYIKSRNPALYIILKFRIKFFGNSRYFSIGFFLNTFSAEIQRFFQINLLQLKSTIILLITSDLGSDSMRKHFMGQHLDSYFA